MAMATMSVSGMWTKPSGLGLDAGLAAQPSGHEVRAPKSSGSDNVVQYRRLPALSDFPRRGKGRTRNSQAKKTTNEFDMVVVPSDGCYMSGSDSDDSDWSVGWFEPHPPEFTDNEAEESFGVLVPSYRLPVKSKSPREEKDSNTPAWAALLANVSLHPNSETQKQLDLWLASLTS